MKREQIILYLLSKGSKNTIEKFNYLTSLTDKDLEIKYNESTQ